MSVQRLTEVVLKGGAAQTYYALVTLLGPRAFSFVNFSHTITGQPFTAEQVDEAVEQIQRDGYESWRLIQYYNSSGELSGPVYSTNAGAVKLCTWLQRQGLGPVFAVARVVKEDGEYKILGYRRHPHATIPPTVFKGGVQEAIMRNGRTPSGVLLHRLPKAPIEVNIGHSTTTLRIGGWRAAMTRIGSMSAEERAVAIIRVGAPGWIRDFLRKSLGASVSGVYPYERCYHIPGGNRSLGVYQQPNAGLELHEVEFDCDLNTLADQEHCDGPIRDYEVYSVMEILFHVSGGEFTLIQSGAPTTIHKLPPELLVKDEPGDVYEAVLKGGRNGPWVVRCQPREATLYQERWYHSLGWLELNSVGCWSVTCSLDGAWEFSTCAEAYAAINEFKSAMLPLSGAHMYTCTTVPASTQDSDDGGKLFYDAESVARLAAMPD